jgi:hypothetical protein
MSDAMENSNAPLSFDYFPGMLISRPPRFTCGTIKDAPALDWKGMISSELLAVASRFPETKALCSRYDWTLRGSYAGLFSGPLFLIESFAMLGSPLGEMPEIRVVLLVAGLLLLGVSVLLHWDTSRLLRLLVERYNELTGKVSHSA